MRGTDESILRKLGSDGSARLWAQVIAFAPVMFQVARGLRDLGVFKNLLEAANGLPFEDLRKKAELSEYSLNILLDAGESCGLIRREGGRFFATEAASWLEKDKLTRVNMDFTHDVCYQGLFYLEQSLRRERPEGLKVFGEWPTIYEGLTQLPPHALKSWLAFDHFYSDDTFPRVVSYVFKDGARTVLDVGGNTGKFARACASFKKDARITILDYPEQLALAEKESREAGLQDRIRFQPQRLLDRSVPFPKGFDVIWMSQFLDCFGPDDIRALLRRAHDALSENSVLLIMEPFTDNQRFEESKFCLDMTSLYFTCMANGQSRMYRSEDFRRYIAEAGLEVVDEIRVRLSHTVLKCKPFIKSESAV